MSGDTASGGLGRLDWSVPDGTDAVIVELGANDALRGLDPKVTQDGARLQSCASLRTVILLSCSPGCGHRAIWAPIMCSDFDAIYPALASTHPVVFYPFFLDGVAADPQIESADGLHPNAAGVDVIVARILPRVEELIARARTARGS